MGKDQILMFGVESEYAIFNLSHLGNVTRGFRFSGPAARTGIFDKYYFEKLNLKYVDEFLENGSRCYWDFNHPEIATPECTTPWELVRYVKAGDQILTDLAGLAEQRIFRSNVDYSSGTTWGCHESYLTRLSYYSAAMIPCAMIPHLVTRPIYCGAGGFSHFEDGWKFVVAPRLLFFETVVGNSSTCSRPIFHLKDESLSSGKYGRLHIICGENLCSETAIALKVGTTALISHLIELGWSPHIFLADPVGVLRRVARDPTCKVSFTTSNGQFTTAIDVQRTILNEVTKRLDVLPPWAINITALWGQVLDKLEQGPEAVSTILDWAIKFKLYKARAETLGTSIERQRELLHIDTQFGQLGGEGIFTQLDQAGVLDHSLPNIGDARTAMCAPPPIGRAKIRGELIRREDPTRILEVRWEIVRLVDRTIDLSDPFEVTEKVLLPLPDAI